MTSFILEPRALNVKKFKTDAKHHALKNGLSHVAALDELTRRIDPSYSTWSEYQRFETAELLPNSRVHTRLKSDVLLQITLKGFEDDLSDFVAEEALGPMQISAAIPDANTAEFRITCEVEKAHSPRTMDRKLSAFFGTAKNQAPLRERIAPVAKALKGDVTQALDTWAKIRPEYIRQGRSVGAETSLWDAEAMIADVKRHHGEREAIWASKAALGMFDAVPAAWLAILSSSEHAESEFIRNLECGLAACDFAYGPDFNIMSTSHPHFVEAMDTFVTLKQFEAAMHEHKGDTEQAQIVHQSVLGKLTRGQVPQHLLLQSKTLGPQRALA